MKKILLVMIFCLCVENFVFAGQLGQNQYGTYYIEDGGVLAKSKWVALDLDGLGSGYENDGQLNETIFDNTLLE